MEYWNTGILELTNIKLKKREVRFGDDFLIIISKPLGYNPLQTR
jgi:hypothetical protein